MQVDLSGLREAAGGKWLLNLRVLSFGVPFALTTSVLVGSQEIQIKTLTPLARITYYLEAVFANSLALVLCAFVAWIVAKTVLRSRFWKPVPLFPTIALGAILGALKGLATGFGMWALQLEPELAQAITNRIFSAALLGAWLIPSAAVVATVFEKYQNERLALIAERVRESSKQTSTNAAEFSLLLSKIPTSSIKDAKTSSQAASEIRNLVETTIRPLSHRLWRLEEEQVEKFDAWTTIRLSLTKYPFPSLLVATTYSATALFSLWKLTPGVEALGRSLLMWLVIYFVYKAAAVLPTARGKFVLVKVVFVSVIASILGYLGSSMIFEKIPNYAPFETILASWIWLIQLNLIFSIYFGIRDKRDDIRRLLAARYNTQSLTEAAQLALSSFYNREFANILHGQIQNRLLSLALKIETGSEMALSQIVSDVDAILSSANVDIEQSTLLFGKELAAIVRRWEGFATLEIDIEDVEIPKAKENILLQCIEESVSNSIRHGKATNIRIKYSVTADYIYLSVIDDGIGPRAGRPGLGTKYFDLVTGGNWSLHQNKDGGSELNLRL